MVGRVGRALGPSAYRHKSASLVSRVLCENAALQDKSLLLSAANRAGFWTEVVKLLSRQTLGGAAAVMMMIEGSPRRLKNEVRVRDGLKKRPRV